MLGYKILKIRKSLQGFAYEADALLLLSLDNHYLFGTVFFNEDIKEFIADKKETKKKA